MYHKLYFLVYVLMACLSCAIGEDSFYCTPVENSLYDDCNCSEMQKDISSLQNQKSNRPNIGFYFPRSDQTADWVRYHPRFPQMNEITACAWVNPADLRERRVFFSYAVNNQENEFTVFLETSTVLQVWVETTEHLMSFDIAENRDMHICVQYSQPTSRITLYTNGVFRDDTPLLTDHRVTGGGALYFGQEQDSLHGGFVASKAFRGTIHNFMMWPRILSAEEIWKIVSKCHYPVDVVVQTTIDKIEWNGEVGLLHPEQCITL
ncbi:serum amyloid P-component-like [Clavelina lepadiformis]|uniref:serum amyloid P-component-like n=1 Tax=Clavelina lepadiformis TaxID=159417 RepID=UPI004041B2AE